MKTLLRTIFPMGFVAIVMLPQGAFLCISHGAPMAFLLAGCNASPIDVAGHADEGWPSPCDQDPDRQDTDGCHDLRLGLMQTFEPEAGPTLPSHALQVSLIPQPTASLLENMMAISWLALDQANDPPEFNRPKHPSLRI